MSRIFNFQQREARDDGTFVEMQQVTPFWLALAILIALLGGALIFGSVGDIYLAIPRMFFALIFLVLFFLFFGMLTIRINDTELTWSFGYLFYPRWRQPLSDIVQVELTKVNWLYGWGIRFTSEGRLYNAQGFSAVRITKRDGTTFRLGSADPQRLTSFLQARISHNTATVR
ncbi:MAG: hypothetical protein K2Y28_09820 [Burkholderiaceae bacterium]|nr:hypothetical protein [Burkholderiaceae bacterium]